MARNGSGTYTVPNTFLPNTVMSATAVNQNFTDAGSEITNSLARDGQSVMTGQFKAADGNAAAPGIAFGNDTNTGFRRASADEIRWVGGGSDRFYIDSVGKAWFLGAVDIEGALNLNGTITGAGMPDLTAIEALTGTGQLVRTASNTWDLDDGATVLHAGLDGFGYELPTGVFYDLLVPFECEITAATAFADQTGDIVIDVWMDDVADAPPTNADSITASAPITISSGVKSTDSTLTGWTTTIPAGSVLRFNIDSISDITRVSVFLTVTRYA